MTELPGFETFTKRMVPSGKKPYVTLQKRGLLSFNKAAHIALGEPKAVELLYNRTDRLIAMRAVAEDVPHAYPLRGINTKGTAEVTTFIVGATAFTNHYEIPAEISVRRQAEVRDGVLLVDLKDEGVVVTSNRRTKKDAATDAATPTERPAESADVAR